MDEYIKNGRIRSEITWSAELGWIIHHAKTPVKRFHWKKPQSIEKREVQKYVGTEIRKQNFFQIFF